MTKTNKSQADKMREPQKFTKEQEIERLKKIQNQTNKPPEWWESTNARELGMCCAGCDCGHCEIRREIINKILLTEKETLKMKAKNMKRSVHVGGALDRSLDNANVYGYNQAVSDFLKLLE